MSDEKALLAAIWEHPHENTPRLAYSDWLDEHGDEPGRARAELIRAQCELDRLPGDAPQYDALESRAEELIREWGRTWWRAMPKGAKRGGFSRGLPVPDLSSFTIAGMVNLGAARLKAAPLWRYHYGVSGEYLDTLLGWPFLHRLELFALRPPLPDGWAERMAAHPNLRNVSELALIDCEVTADEVTLLLDAWAGRSLRQFAANLNADAVRALADHPTAAGLRGLRSTSSRLTAKGVAALAAGRHLTGLTTLQIGYNRIGDKGLEELLRWPGLRGLRALYINDTGITDDGVRALAACPACANLRTLWLSSNPLTADAARAVLDSPHLKRLKRVSLYDTEAINTPAEAALRKRFGRGNY